MHGPLKPLSELLSSGFSRLIERAEAAQGLTERVRRCLGEPLGAHVLSANRRGEELVVRVDSAAWAAQVRYAGQRLIEVLDGDATISRDGKNETGALRLRRVRVRVGRP